MRNLKKVLSLVLCMAMMLSVMVMGTGAAFTDQEEIVNDEAVDMCSALNIINGYPDGSYAPEGTITRAEACKMICIALNGGKEPVLGTNAVPTFSDIDGLWAEAYIEYCYSEGIVAGVGDGKFDPSGNVTGTQFAKMLLIALGYSADHEKFVGEAWAVNVNVKASQNDLYNEIETMDPNLALTRDNAAQMVWNTLQADMVCYDYQLATDDSGALVSKLVVKNDPDKGSLLEEKFNTDDTDNTTGILTGVKYNTVKGEYTYTVKVLGDNNALGDDQTYVTEYDYTDLLYQNVTFVIEKDDKDVYGAFTADCYVMAAGLVGDIDFDSYDAVEDVIEIDEVEYDVDENLAMVEIDINDNHSFAVTAYADMEAFAAATAYYQFAAYDWNDDADIDAFVVVPVAFAEIAYVGSDYVNFVGVPGKYEISDEDFSVYEGVAKEDKVIVSGDSSLLTLGFIDYAEAQTGVVESYNDTDVVIDGVAYDHTCVPGEVTGTLLNKEVEFYEINGYIVAIEASSAVDVSEIVLVTAVTEDGKENMYGYHEAELLFADGTSEVVTIKTVNITDTNEDGDFDDFEDVTADKPIANQLYTYEISSGKYELVPLGDDDLADFDAIAFDDDYDMSLNIWNPAKSYSDADAKITVEGQKARFAEDAVVFVKDGDDFSVETGATVSKITSSADNTKVYVAGAEKNSNNALTITFAYISTDGVANSDTQYGYIVSNVSNAKDSDGSYQAFSLSDIADPVRTASGENANGAAKGDVISYMIDADGYLTDVEVIGKVGALTVIDGEFVTINGMEFEMDDEDTTVLYVDSSVPAGAEGGYLQVATEAENGGYYPNVIYFDDPATDVLELLVVDVNNEIDGAPVSVPTQITEDANVVALKAEDADIVLSGKGEDTAAETGDSIGAIVSNLGYNLSADFVEATHWAALKAQLDALPFPANVFATYPGGENDIGDVEGSTAKNCINDRLEANEGDITYMTLKLTAPTGAESATIKQVNPALTALWGTANGEKTSEAAVVDGVVEMNIFLLIDNVADNNVIPLVVTYDDGTVVNYNIDVATLTVA